MSIKSGCRDVPSSISEQDLQDLVDVAFGAAEYVNYTFREGAGPYESGRRVHNVSAVRNLPYEPALKVRVEQTRERRGDVALLSHVHVTERRLGQFNSCERCARVAVPRDALEEKRRPVLI